MIKKAKPFLSVLHQIRDHDRRRLCGPAGGILAGKVNARALNKERMFFIKMLKSFAMKKKIMFIWGMAAVLLTSGVLAAACGGKEAKATDLSMS
jgi:predicted benzoate:H+ symporter BenE